MENAVAALRRFNRAYTSFAGLLDARYNGSDMSLAEARALYEIAHGARLASDIQAVLRLDPGYLSRIVRGFQTRGWITRGRGADARQRPIELTPAGRDAFSALDRTTHDRAAGQLAGLADADRQALTAALDSMRALLGGGGVAPYEIRTFRAGDMGMIAARQAILYEPYGWGRPMEALLGEVTAAFVRHFKPGRDQCWIAERAGVMAGSVMLVDAGDGVAKLRLLYVEPWARGLGIGGALVDRCVAFARDAGYARIALWTHTVLASARRIYAAAGFHLTETAIHHDFGRPEQGETWELDLADIAREA
ncbi:GNAT family N-acetyltransferase [Sphingomonas gilva]|uniref:GNAT family N-acetyltransferase n=1 Tax=Sphingomonas gilva TaxID=2305907 RepID=A0A396RR85_9SPHN|nr:helix-turn-helix domain-containing GNAT family N-acetyltransferase [Sphingomonas gilva]RHW18899.1 GNAT family N-acetyltransferase [Sphingomonas gilva]